MRKRRTKKEMEEVQKEKFWCPKCDKSLLFAGQVCGFCGHKLSPHIKEYKKS